MAIAVSNSSPLIHLAAIGSFELLRDFFQEIRIPPAVSHEVERLLEYLSQDPTPTLDALAQWLSGHQASSWL